MFVLVRVVIVRAESKGVLRVVGRLSVYQLVAVNAGMTDAKSDTSLRMLFSEFC